MEYFKDVTVHGKYDGLLHGMVLVKYYETVLGSAVIFVNG